MEIAGYNMPEELYYDQYHFWTRVDGDELVIGMDDFAEKLAGQIVYQDMELAEGMQAGMHSRGYQDAYLPGQETRIRFFHEVLNDYLEGRR